MRVCIYGAGAIGSHLVARLAVGGRSEVSVIARGPQLAAIRAKGIELRTEGARILGHPHAVTDDPATLPPQDLVVVTMKSHAWAPIVAPLVTLLAPAGIVLFAANGIPWWWHADKTPSRTVEALDPGSRLWTELGVSRCLGAVIYSSNEVVEPGVVVHTGSGRRWVIGEPDGSTSARAAAVVDLLSGAGLDAVQSRDIRRDVARKLCVNISANPIGALTLLSTRAAAEVPGLQNVVLDLVRETLAVFAAIGTDLRAELSAEDVVGPPGGRGAFKSSMQQDVEAGRALEVEPIIGQLQAFGREAGLPTPTIDVVAALLRGRDRAGQAHRERGAAA